MTNIVTLEKKPEPNKLRCTGCAATIDAPCDCGLPYNLLKPSEAARIVLKKNPNLSLRDVAKEAGVDHTTVKRVRDAQMLQNATANAWPPEKDARMLQLREEGMTNKEIAKELGTTEGAISGRRARLMFKKLDPASRRLPPIMPDNILQIAIEHAGLAKNHMYELDAISMYADQMHEDAKHRIAEEIKVIYDFSRDIIKRLIGDMRDIKPSACDVEIRTRKED